MARFMLTYDLHKVRNYTALLAKLKAYNAASPGESVWLVDYPGSAEALYANLATTTDRDDSIFVVNLDNPKDWYSMRSPEPAVDWMLARFGGSRFDAPLRI